MTKIKRGIISNKLFILILFFLSVITIETFIIFKYIKYNKYMKNSLISLFPGERISYFEIIGSRGEEINSSVFDKKEVSALFIFEQPCTPCNKNIEFWQRLAKVFKGRIKIYGIIIDEPNDAFNFAEEKKLNFKLYVPLDKKKFIEALRIRTKWAHTILYSSKVNYLKLGNLTFEDFIKLTKKIKKLINTQ